MSSSTFDVCNHCGRKSQIHFHRINKKMVRSFIRLVNRCRDTGRRVKIKDLDLDVSDNNNFQKLQYFGLVTRGSDGYMPTELGYKFHSGERWIWSRVATLDNERLSNNHWSWDKKKEKYKPSKIFVFDLIPKEYKTREEYKKHALINKLFPG